MGKLYDTDLERFRKEEITVAVGKPTERIEAKPNGKNSE